MLHQNPVLIDLAGLSGLKSVSGDVYIARNESLCQSDAEAFVASISVSGTVTVEDNGSARTDCP